MLFLNKLPNLQEKQIRNVCENLIWLKFIFKKSKILKKFVKTFKKIVFNNPPTVF